MGQPPDKADGAFRTIREVADWLSVPTHVLRFWESKFDSIAPVKGAGGRRYYRPEDMRLLGGIKVLLHDQGLTIRGVTQRIEADGPESVMALSPPLDAAEAPSEAQPRVNGDGDGARVVPFQARPAAAEPGAEAAGPARTAIRKEGGERPERAAQPDAPDAREAGGEPSPGQPVDAPTPPQPVDGPPDEPDSPPQPTDVDGSGALPRREPGRRRLVLSPAEADRDEATPDDDDGEELEGEEDTPQLGDPEEDGKDEEDAAPPTVPATTPIPPTPPTPTPTPIPHSTPAPARRGVGILSAPGDRRRLGRVVRRLRAMIDEVERELSGGSGR